MNQDLIVLNMVAEILVTMNYAESVKKGMSTVRQELDGYVRYDRVKTKTGTEKVDPFYAGSDLRRECIARRQMDQIEDFLFQNHYELWVASAISIPKPEPETSYGWRIAQFKYCLWELSKQSEE